MNTFNMADFLTNDGLVILAGSYTETVKNCGSVVSVIGTSPNPANKECYRYTFWLFQMPMSDGNYHVWPNKLIKEKVVIDFPIPIRPSCRSSKIWTSTFS
jgi:hypothetical protein